MKITNYSSIAHKYDENQYRLDELRFDSDLKEYTNRNKKSLYHVLDLSCGTGLYLEKQMKFFEGQNIEWHGLDACKAMLEKAKKRLSNVTLIEAYAEETPYQPETFDFIYNNYAFHHYAEKEKALDEICRVLVKGGIYKLHNIAIHKMQKWWVYHYFPSAYYEDLKRFWDSEVIFNELVTRGFDINLKIEYRMEKIRVSDYLSHAVNRDISVLTLINDRDYEEGLERMKYDLSMNPNKTIVNDFAEMFCIARKL